MSRCACEDVAPGAFFQTYREESTVGLSRMVSLSIRIHLDAGLFLRPWCGLKLVNWCAEQWLSLHVFDQIHGHEI